MQKNFFFSVYVIFTTCDIKCLLFHVITGRHCFYKSLLIFIRDMFYFLEDFDITNYADDSTPYCAGKSAEFVVNN